MQLAKKNVLVVEDDELQLSLIASALTSAGFAVDKANRGSRAIELCANQFYDVVIVDYRIPDLDGVELVKVIRKSRDWSSTKFIAMTAEVETLKRRDAEGDCFDCVIAKPLSVGALVAAVQGEFVDEVTTSGNAGLDAQCDLTTKHAMETASPRCGKPNLMKC